MVPITNCISSEEVASDGSLTKESSTNCHCFPVIREPHSDQYRPETYAEKSKPISRPGFGENKILGYPNELGRSW